MQDILSLYQVTHLAEAEQVLAAILLEHPNQADANFHLATLLANSDRIDESLPYFRVALEAAPEEADYWLGYIDVLIRAGLYEDAALVLQYGQAAGLSGAAFDELTRILAMSGNPGAQAPAHAVSAAEENALLDLFSAQRYAELELKLQAQLKQYPDWLVGWKMLTDTLIVQKKDALFAASQALALNNNDAKEHCYYGLLLKNQGDLTAAAQAFEHAIRLQPDYAAAYNNLGIVKKDLGDIEAGIACYRQALKLNPGYASCFSNLLFGLSHSAQINAQDFFKAHLEFAQQYEQPLKARWPRHKNLRQPGRPLQVGFVSADFRDHSLAYFIAPVLQHLSTSGHLTLHAYSASSLEDEVTRRLRGYFKHWHAVAADTDVALAHRIEADVIDILVDLDGHTAGNRLQAFALKPAPIQLSWLGYLATTGLSAMDYYLADAYLLPPGQLDAQFTEQLVQLPANAPFTPFDDAPALTAPPAVKNGYITFASFNRVNKITIEAVRLWAQLLRALPTARMLLGAMPQEGSYDYILAWFAQEGIHRDRLICHPRSTMDAYLNLHGSVDICLDTFPSNGVTTTCHALWMGVPTLCLTGDRLASRGALAVMRHMGLDTFVAADAADFVLKGIYWTEHTSELAALRAGMRTRFNASNLAQPAVVSHALESAFTHMWQRWCQGLPAFSFDASGL